MILTQENYYSPEANRAYFSASQVKALLDCPARAMAELRGEWKRPAGTALLVGSYVDAHFSKELDVFRAQHPEIYTRTGDLRAEYRQAESIIARLERDELAMRMLEGERQRIVTGEIGGEPFKAKLDCLLSGETARKIAEDYPGMDGLLFAEGAIVDLKIMRDFKPMYREGEGRLNFVEYWGYDLQMAIYQALMWQETGERLPCYILAASKEPVTDIGLYMLPQAVMDAAMNALLAELPMLSAVKAGQGVESRCETCEWCRETKVLEAAAWPDGIVELEAAE